MSGNPKGARSRKTPATLLPCEMFERRRSRCVDRDERLERTLVAGMRKRRIV